MSPARGQALPVLKELQIVHIEQEVEGDERSVLATVRDPAACLGWTAWRLHGGAECVVVAAARC
jgi:hypothetical protein